MDVYSLNGANYGKIKTLRSRCKKNKKRKK